MVEVEMHLGHARVCSNGLWNWDSTRGIYSLGDGGIGYQK